MIASVLLVVHIVAGATALAAAFVALGTGKGAVLHVRAGRVYAAAMTLVCASALPLALYDADMLLVQVGMFSFYLVFAGWRFARAAGGRARAADRAAALVLGFTGLGMWSYGAVLFARGDAQWATLALFGSIAVALSLVDWRYHRAPRRTATERIARHLTHMLAGTIATVTAVVVVNVDTEPAWLAWILPTVVMTPLIVWWNRRVRRGTEWYRGSGSSLL